MNALHKIAPDPDIEPRPSAGFVLYVTRDLDTDEFYVGKHECTCRRPCQYLGSGKWLRTHPRKHRLIRETIGDYADAKALEQAERRVVELVREHPKCRNVADGGGGYTTRTALAYWASKTPEQRSASARKAHATRRRLRRAGGQAGDGGN